VKERQPKKEYWGVVNELGELDLCVSRKEALATAARWIKPSYMAEPYVHVVRLTPEVVKTVRRKS
jgi:hypothetical protein